MKKFVLFYSKPYDSHPYCRGTTMPIYCWSKDKVLLNKVEVDTMLNYLKKIDLQDMDKYLQLLEEK